MRRAQIPVVFASALAGLAQFAILGAFAQAPAAPGADHGFLIDKHVAARISCAQCHAQSTATPPPTATCLSCHGGTYAKLAAMTAKDAPNPHASHRGDVDCAECHHVHKASVTLCNQCHTYDMTTP
jgi:fumarate reductase flavoprotein subunit